MVENKVLRRIFVPKRDKVTGDWRRLHNKELYDMYSSNIIQVIKNEKGSVSSRHGGRGGF